MAQVYLAFTGDWRWKERISRTENPYLEKWRLLQKHGLAGIRGVMPEEKLLQVSEADDELVRWLKELADAAERLDKALPEFCRGHDNYGDDVTGSLGEVENLLNNAVSRTNDQIDELLIALAGALTK